MKNLLIDIYPHYEFQDILESLKKFSHNSIGIKFICFKGSFENKNKNYYNLRNKIDYIYEEKLDIDSINSNINSDIDSDKVYKYLDIMLSDAKLMSIFDRSFYLKISYNTSKIRLISILFFQAVNFLNKAKIDAYILYATPHNINNYILKWACFALGIDVIYLQESILPWRYYIKFERENKAYLYNKGDEWSNVDEELIKDYHKRLSNDDYTASYIYQGNQTSKKPFTFIDELNRFWKRPDLIINKFYIYKLYSEMSKNFHFPRSGYVFFPLHFTPERSTLPDGGVYFEQFRAIHEIRSKISKDIKIVIKEHPTTFTDVCHWKERNKNFYESIKGLGNIVFAPLGLSSVQLIKNSIMSISINSSIILDTILLNKVSYFMSGHRIFGTESKNLYHFENLRFGKISSFKKNPEDKYNLNYNWFKNYTIRSSYLDKAYDHNLNNLVFERSRNYNKMISEIAKIYSKEDITGYLKSVNEF